MKILLVTGAIYAQNSSRKHFTGLDYVVTQIGQSLSNDNEIVFFTTSPIGEKSVVDGCKVYSYSNMSVIPYILKVGLKKYANVMKMKCSFKEKIKNARSMIIAEYFESIIEKENEKIELTKNELKIIHYLILNKDKIISRDEIMDYLWESESFIDDNTLSVNMKRLRNKLEKLGMKDCIETKRGQGYILK